MINGAWRYREEGFNKRVDNETNFQAASSYSEFRLASS